MSHRPFSVANRCQVEVVPESRAVLPVIFDDDAMGFALRNRRLDGTDNGLTGFFSLKKATVLAHDFRPLVPGEGTKSIIAVDDGEILYAAAYDNSAVRRIKALKCNVRNRFHASYPSVLMPFLPSDFAS
nr:hypothetical protein [Marinobacter adhaerens]